MDTERNYMSADSLVELDFITDTFASKHTHGNIELIFLISGSLDYIIENQHYDMSTGDYVVVNMGQEHSYSGSREVLFARFCISYVKLKEIVGTESLLFWCNTTMDHNEAYDELRKNIIKILNYTLAENNKNEFYRRSLFYQLVSILTEKFLLADNSGPCRQGYVRDDERMSSLSYVRSNNDGSDVVETLYTDCVQLPDTTLFFEES